MQSSILSSTEIADADAQDRRRPGRFDDVSLDLISLLRGDAPAETLAMVAEPDLLPGYTAVSVAARDPIAERQTALKIALIIVALVGVVLFLGK